MSDGQARLHNMGGSLCQVVHDHDDRGDDSDDDDDFDDVGDGGDNDDYDDGTDYNCSLPAMWE